MQTNADAQDVKVDGPAAPQASRTLEADHAVFRRSSHFRNDFPLAISRVHSHAECRLHAHEFSELVIVLRGSGMHVTPESKWPIGAGDAFVLHGDQEHGYVDTAGLDLVNIMFIADELDLPSADIALLPGYHALFTLEPRVRQRDEFESRLRLKPDQLRAVAALVDRLEHEIRDTPPGWRYSARACFMLIVTDLSRYFERADAPAAVTLQRLGRVLSFIEERLEDAPRIAEIADAGYMSPRSLSRAFRAALGCSPVQYMVRLRVQRAHELLQSTERSVTDIAFGLGYKDGNYFSRQFRAATGMTPREVRRAQP